MSDPSESKPGEGPGTWFNPRTGENLHPDLEHEPPIGPHWDWRAPDGMWWRWFSDDRLEGKRQVEGPPDPDRPPRKGKSLVIQPLPVALDYVSWCLAKQPGLAGRVQALGLLAAGEAVAVVPDGTTIERAHAFETGGLALEELTTADLPEPDRMYFLAHMLQAYVAATPSATVLIQDVSGSSANPRYQEATEAKFEHEDCPYFIIDHQNITADELRWAFRGTVSWYVAALVCDVAVPQEVLASHQASDGVIDDLAQHVVQVICNAYDQDSFVIWLRGRLQRLDKPGESDCPDDVAHDFVGNFLENNSKP
jgi:hypothetical protein